MSDTKLRVVFGETEISRGVISAKIVPGVATPKGIGLATVVLTTDSLVSAVVDYRSEARIFARTHGREELTFTGIVDSVTPLGDETEIHLVTGLKLLEESSMGGLGISGGKGRLREHEALEASWSMMRASGVEAERIDIEGFTPGPRGLFEVAVAVDGMDLVDPVEMFGVQFVPRGPVSQLADGLGPHELWQAYAEASVWALALPMASTLFEAETEGLKAIDVALAGITALSQYSTSRLPTGGVRDFKREWTRSRVARRDVVLVKRSPSGVRWLRSLTDIPNQPVLNANRVDNLTENSHGKLLYPETMREALLAWRRAVDTSDSLSTVVALWEAVEFYASGVKVAKLFESAEIKRIRKAVLNDLEGEKAKRMSEILAQLNQPPLLIRLKAALEADGVPHTENELAVLGRIRKARNDLVHGRSRREPSDRDVMHAIAVVNRILVYRLARASKRASS